MAETTVKTMKRIDAPNAPVLEKMLKEAATAADDVIVDMTDTVYICSVGLRVFMSMQKKMKTAGKSMVIKHVADTTMEIFEMTGMAGILTIE